MKKMFVAMAITFVFVAGFLAGGFTKGFEPEWDYSRGVGNTEVRADYDIAIGDEVYYEMLLWDEEYENYEIVERGMCHKDELNELSETARLYQDVFEAGYRR